MKFCPECGTKRIESSKFCYECGYNFTYCFFHHFLCVTRIHEQIPMIKSWRLFVGIKVYYLTNNTDFSNEWHI